MINIPITAPAMNQFTVCPDIEVKERESDTQRAICHYFTEGKVFFWRQHTRNDAGTALVIALPGAFSGIGGGRFYGGRPYVGGGLGLILVIVLILVLFG